VSLIPLSEHVTIDTNVREHEIWQQIGHFESEHYVSNFRSFRISSPTLTTHVHRLDEFKKANNLQKASPKLEILPQVGATDEKIVREIALNARQTRAFYETSKNMSELTRPIILFYSFEKLANVILLNTFEHIPDSFSHGLSYHNGVLYIMKEGLFPRLHDCYSSDPAIYLNKYQFKLENLCICAPTSEQKILDMMNDITIRIQIRDELSGKDVEISEIDREFLFLYSLSSLARYDVNEWSDIIEGRNDDLIIDIRRYLHSIQTTYPNWLLNFLHLKRLLFSPIARIGF
jgi:hypothetical protein